MGEAATHRVKRPHAKGVLCDALFLAAYGGKGKSLSVWVRLGRAKRPHAKEVHDLLSPAAYGGDR